MDGERNDDNPKLLLLFLLIVPYNSSQLGHKYYWHCTFVQLQNTRCFLLNPIYLKIPISIDAKIHLEIFNFGNIFTNLSNGTS